MDIFRNTNIIRKARKNEEGMLIKPNFSLNQNEDPKDSYKLDELSKTSKKICDQYCLKNQKVLIQIKTIQSLNIQ